MAFCQQCGTQNPDGSRFCTGCGADLTAQVAPQQAAPVNPNPAPYQQQPTYGQTPQAFAQSGIGNYGTPAGLSKKDFLNLPENSKTKSNIKATAIIAPIIAIATIILSIVELEEYKNTLRLKGYYLIDGYMSNYYILWSALIISAVFAIVAYFMLNIVPSIIATVSFLFGMIFAVSKGARMSFWGYAMVVMLIFMIYYLHVFNKQYEEYKGRSGMNL